MHRLILGALCLALAAEAVPARDWGFSKDTVHQRPRADTAYLTNNGVDTLHLDSAFIEVIQAPDSRLGVWMTFYPYQYNASTPPTQALLGFSTGYGNNIGSWANIAPGGSITLMHFDPQGCLCVGKRAANAALAKGVGVAAVGDSLKARVRFRSKTGEEDTLVVIGIDDPVGSVRGFMAPGISKGRGLADRDLRGRRLAPQGRLPTMNVPAAP